MRAFGASPLILDAAQAVGPRADTDFEVWPENWEAVRVFLSLSSSWTWVTPAFVRPLQVGIAATEILATLEMMGVAHADRAGLLDQVRVMEQAALEVLTAAS